MTKTTTAGIQRGAEEGSVGARFLFIPCREHDCCCMGKPGVLFQRVLESEHGMAQVLAIAGSLWTRPPNKLFFRAVSFGWTLIQSQLGTTAAENHQDTSIDLCSCNYGPFPREIGHQQMLIRQQLLYRDSLEFPSEREEAITRPPRARHNPMIKNRVNRVPGLQQGEYANA